MEAGYVRLVKTGRRRILDFLSLRAFRSCCFERGADRDIFPDAWPPGLRSLYLSEKAVSLNVFSSLKQENPINSGTVNQFNSSEVEFNV